jgi:hypothetical protein
MTGPKDGNWVLFVALRGVGNGPPRITRPSSIGASLAVCTKAVETMAPEGVPCFMCPVGVAQEVYRILAQLPEERPA